MAGTLTMNDGERTPIFFTVKAEADRARNMLTGAPIRLSGQITVGGIARDASTEGTLEVKLARITGKELVYRLDFRGEDGKAYAFMGQKNVTVRRAVAGMTTLAGRLYRGTKALGRGELTFDLKHLPPFLRSFRLS